MRWKRRSWRILILEMILLLFLKKKIFGIRTLPMEFLCFGRLDLSTKDVEKLEELMTSLSSQVGGRKDVRLAILLRQE